MEGGLDFDWMEAFFQGEQDHKPAEKLQKWAFIS
jgi:hypothetical protein